MRLQNVARTPPTNIPLLYICERCRTMLTIPPQECPVPEPMKLRGIDTKM